MLSAHGETMGRQVLPKSLETAGAFGPVLLVGRERGLMYGPLVAFQIARGTVVAGRYRAEREVGAGGMGSVWAATELRTKRPVALKVIRRSAHSEGELRKRFLREARATSAVAHPNVVEVLDAFDLQGEGPVLVMELLEGETLADLLDREERLTLEQCAGLIIPALSAVGTAHARGIVHRDLKPSNIFLARNASGVTTVKVLDFGVAKLFMSPGGLGQTQSTRTGASLGTPSYMAPEQATGQKDVDHLADVWALGVILYECLAGSRPIEGDTVGQVVMSLMSTGITPLERLVPDLPEEVCRLVERMLSRERLRRPRDLREPFALLAHHTSVRAPDFGSPTSSPLGLERAEEKIRVVEAPAQRLRSAFPTRAAAVTTFGLAATLGAAVPYFRRPAASASAFRAAAPTASEATVPQRASEGPVIAVGMAPQNARGGVDPGEPTALRVTVATAASVAAAGSSTGRDPALSVAQPPGRKSDGLSGRRVLSPAAAVASEGPPIARRETAEPKPANPASSSAPSGFRGGLAEDVPF